MVELNLTNFITIGLISMAFFALVEVVKHKMGVKQAASS